MNTIQIVFSQDAKDFLTELLLGGVAKAANPKKKVAPVEEDDEEEDEEEEAPPVKKAVKKPAKVEEEDEEDETEDEDEEEDEPKYTVKRVQEKCQQLITAGKAAKLKALLGEFGYAKVAEIKPKDFDKFMGKANKIK